MKKWWECQCCGKKYPEEISDQFDTCPNCGLELGEPVNQETENPDLIINRPNNEQ